MKFDPTINVPTIIAALGLAVAGAAAWSTSNERHARSEARISQQEQNARTAEDRITGLLREFKADNSATLNEIRSDLREMRRERTGR